MVFADFCEMAAMSLANAVEKCDAREAKYMKIVGRYARREVDAFCQMMACVVEGLDHEVDGQLREGGKPAFPGCDFLGSLFMDLELASHWKGQFFTPYHLCEMMARMTFSPEDMRVHVERDGFITLIEPASGAGAMVIAFASAVLEGGFNPQQQLHVTAIDVDQTAAYMAFIQLSLLGIPATVYVGNALTMEMREVLHTPFHHLGLWRWKLDRRHQRLAQERASFEADSAPTAVVVASTPLPAVPTLDLETSTRPAAAAALAPPPRARALLPAPAREADVAPAPAVQTDLFA